jgi:GNAT superfamily N-acetyltransferase
MRGHVVTPVRREWRRGEYAISTDPTRLDVDLIHDFLARRSYWAQEVPRQVVERSIDHALCFGLYAPAAQVGFARVVTDYAVFAYLGDVFVIESHRGRGLGTWLVETVIGCPELQGLRRWDLATNDAHELYRRFGFREADAARAMERLDPAPDLYRRSR